MELRYFFSVLSKRKWLLLAVMLAAATATFILVSKMPHKFKASALLETGITNFRSLRVGEANPFVQEFEIENRFANLTEYMKSRPAITALTKKLILHDLRPDTGVIPFRKLDLEKLGFPKERLDSYLNALETRPDSLGISEKDIENLFTARNIEKALGYDYETIREQLEMKRSEKSDYLRIEYQAENPELTYYVAKNFVDEFLKFYYAKKDTSENRSLVFYRHFMDDKKRILDSLNRAQVSYAEANGLVAPQEQAQAIVTQIKDLEMARDEEEKRKVGYVKSVAYYERFQDQYKDAIKGGYKESVTSNTEIKRIDEEIGKLNDRWVDSNLKDDNIKKQLENLHGKKVLVSQQIALSVRDNTDPVLVRQQELFLSAIKSNSDLAAAEQAVGALDKRILTLYSQKRALVKDNAVFNRFEQQIEIARKEYDYAIDKQNQADVIKKSGDEEAPMKVIEYPVYPYRAESNKRTLLSSFAGIGAGTLTMVFMFMLTYFDRSLGSVFQYEKQVGLPLLAPINYLNPKKWNNFDDFFKQNVSKKDSEYFKEALRKVRHDIEASGAKSFLFTSLKDQEGKSFLIAALAYSFTLKSKKVLIIDTNFKNNTLTSLSVKPFMDNPVTSAVQTSAASTRLNFAINIPTVDIIGNQGGHNSPSELLSGVDFKKKMVELGQVYDYIFLEAAALNKYSDARELVDFVEKVIPIFDATTILTKTDANGLEFLQSLGNQMLGSVLNKANLRNLN